MKTIHGATDEQSRRLQDEEVIDLYISNRIMVTFENAERHTELSIKML
jgi:hypothetical protein